MLHSLNNALAPALVERLTLLLNHMLSSEPLAMQRLQRHAGRTVEIAIGGWPSLLPLPPASVFRITPAGLLDWCGIDGMPSGQSATADLLLRVDASNPALLFARAVGGTAPAVNIEGDAELAGDVNWLLQNLRWDIAADLERAVGPVVAQQLQALGSMVATALRRAVQGVQQVGSRLRPRG